MLKQAGIVQIFNLTGLASSKPITTIKSDRPYANFGSKLKVENRQNKNVRVKNLKTLKFKFYDTNDNGTDDLFVTASLRTESFLMFRQGTNSIKKHLSILKTHFCKNSV